VERAVQMTNQADNYNTFCCLVSAIETEVPMFFGETQDRVEKIPEHQPMVVPTDDNRTKTTQDKPMPQNPIGSSPRREVTAEPREQLNLDSRQTSTPPQRQAKTTQDRQTTHGDCWRCTNWKAIPSGP
jgi:hypothetical protein